MSERNPYIVAARKIDPEERDTFREFGAGYRNMDGADDTGEEANETGSWVFYRAELTDEGAEAFRAASNCEAAGGYVEPDEVDTADDADPVPVEGEEAAADVELPDSYASVASGKTAREAAGKALANLFSDGESIDSAVRDAGVDPAVLRYLGLYDMGAMGAYGQDVIVAIGDTGVDGKYFSASLKGRFLAGKTYFGDTGLDRTGHGTWVAACAVPSGAEWIYGKVLGDDGSGSRSNVVSFIRWAAKYIHSKGKRGVINLSLSGGEGISQAYQDAIAYANSLGVSVTCSAGNNGRSGGKPGPPGTSPSAKQSASVNHRNHRVSDYSSYPVKVRACAAPGESVQGVNKAMSGTSMSAPADTRVMTCLLSDEAARKLTVRQVEDHLLAACDMRGNSKARVGHGVIRGAEALKRMRAQPKPVPKPEPPKPKPEPEKEYLPRLPRVARWQFAKAIVPHDMKECVVVLGDTELGHFVPKED